MYTFVIEYSGKFDSYKILFHLYIYLKKYHKYLQLREGLIPFEVPHSNELFIKVFVRLSQVYRMTYCIPFDIVLFVYIFSCCYVYRVCYNF